MFPAEFEKSVRELLGEEEGGRLLEALDGEAVVSVRYNPFKLSAMPSRGEGADPVPWNRYGAYLAERPVFTLDPAMHAGAYYVQEASSQFVEYPLRAALNGSDHPAPAGHPSTGGEPANALNLDDSYRRRESAWFPSFGGVAAGTADGVVGNELLKSRSDWVVGNAPPESRSDGMVGNEFPEGLRILDLCAAPGGKTTLYSTLAGVNGLVVANEVIKQRAGVLADNVRRWGIGNVAVSCNEAADFAAYKHWFDVLAVDAPCSGEGMFRKNPQARTEWSRANVEMCAARQRKILADAWDALRPGGILIYSTCTFNRRENEENVAWLADNFAVEPVAIDVPAEWGVECGEVFSGKNHPVSPSDCPRYRPPCGLPGAFSSPARSARKGYAPSTGGEPANALNLDDSYRRRESAWFPSFGGVAAGTADGVVRGIKTFRFYPHRVRGEGFFAAVMRKADGRVKRETPRPRREPLIELNRPESRPLAGWVAQPEAMKFARAGENCYAFYRPVYRDVAALAGGLNIIYSGVCMGQIFNGKLRPDHALALFHDLAHTDSPATVTPLTTEEALDYLRKREFADVSRLAEGLNLLIHEGENGLPIGWTKRIGHRTNTMLPNSFRIVNL